MIIIEGVWDGERVGKGRERGEERERKIKVERAMLHVGMYMCMRECDKCTIIFNDHVITHMAHL